MERFEIHVRAGKSRTRRKVTAKGQWLHACVEETKALHGP